METHEIRTPVFTLAASDIPNVEIIQNQNENDPRLSYFSIVPTPIRVPVIWRDSLLPFHITSPSFRRPTDILICIEKEPKSSLFTVRIGNFGPLPKLFRQGVLHVMVQCYLGSHTLVQERESFEVNEAGIAVCVLKPQIDFATELNLNPQFNEVCIGLFKVDVFWKFSFTLQGTFLSYTPTDTQELQKSVSLLAETRRECFQIPKQLLAASSPYFKAQLEFNPEIKEITPNLDENIRIGEESLLAFFQFITGYGMTKPIESCSVALDLLKAGHYNALSTMETTMQNILLAQPANWYSLKTSFEMFSFANKIGSAFTGEHGRIWHNLKWKALRNLKCATFQELHECDEIVTHFGDPLAFDVFTTLLSVA